MTDHEKNMFLRALGAKEVPAKVERLYNQVKKLADRIVAAPMQPAVIALIAVLAGEGKNDVSVAPDIIKWETIKKGAQVSTFLDGQARSGTFLAVCGSKNPGTLRIKIDGDSENFREIAESEVKLKD
jgi:hypothetical protein